MDTIFLETPKLEDLHYRQKWMMDPKTMSYNSGYDLDIKGYDKEIGTISKTDEELKDWYDKWTNKEPDKYFAYIYHVEEDEPVGEVYYYKDNDTYSMGILIQDKYRGKGYSYPALLELEKVAFERNDISELSDIIPSDRESAIKAFEKAGFIHTDKENQLLITKEMYFENEENIYE